MAAICARKADVVQKVVSRSGISEASTDWQKSLLEIKPDIVALTTPAILRTEVIELAAQLGCHILCEKPLATHLKRKIVSLLRVFQLRAKPVQ